MERKHSDKVNKVDKLYKKLLDSFNVFSDARVKYIEQLEKLSDTEKVSFEKEQIRKIGNAYLKLIGKKALPKVDYLKVSKVYYLKVSK
jgi:hypothetical protein